MRGRRLHNAIVNELAWTCRAHGAWARTEAYLGPRVGWADIVAGNGTRLLLIEVELTPARVGSDLAKAIGNRIVHVT